MKRISVTSDRGMLRLRWRYLGKVFSLSLGLEDSRANRAFANGTARAIADDIRCGAFDATLLKYKPRLVGSQATDLSCQELFERFTDAVAKDKALCPGSLCRYRGCLSHIRSRLQYDAHAVDSQIAGNFAAVLLERVSNRTAREYLWLLQSCWSWAEGKYHLSGENPWPEQIVRIKTQPTQKVKPFTHPEITAILEGFRTHPQYSHYSDFVAFLFGTGCRFGEAAGLRWQHLGDTFETAWIGESISRGHRKTTKTGKARTVVLSPGIQAMLRSRSERLKPNPTGLVFPSPKGKPINDHNFSRRAWRTVLDAANVLYRKLYTTRHSAISHALANGANPIALAEQSGHDKRVLLATYAHVIEPKPVFQEF